jgi:hypothetical protein
MHCRLSKARPAFSAPRTVSRYAAILLEDRVTLLKVGNLRLSTLLLAPSSQASGPLYRSIRVMCQSLTDKSSQQSRCQSAPSCTTCSACYCVTRSDAYISLPSIIDRVVAISCRILPPPLQWLEHDHALAYANFAQSCPIKRSLLRIIEFAASRHESPDERCPSLVL